MPVLLQTKNFGRTACLHILQFLEQRFGTFLLGIELGHKRIVFHASLQFAILRGKLGILIFHFALVEFGKLTEFGKFLFLFFQFLLVAIAANEQTSEDDND